jgi:hypothetical protein
VHVHHVQADSVLKDSILVLRQENALLMVEINELKNDLGLREDQVRSPIPLSFHML